MKGPIESPSESHEPPNWARNLIDTVRDGGVWMIPATGAIYRFDKKAHCLWQIGPPTRNTASDHWAGTLRIARAFGYWGWTVREL